jgi:hypothetical protein
MDYEKKTNVVSYLSNKLQVFLVWSAGSILSLTGKYFYKFQQKSSFVQTNLK